MKVCENIKCINFPCNDINKNNYLVPYKKINPQKIKIIMITEAPPADKQDYFYAQGNPFYLQTTVQAFNDAGINISTMQEILNLGIYITTAIKCGKTQYTISTDTIKNCSEILEKEINLFPNIKVFLLMGDVAIKSMNYIWKSQTGRKVIPDGSTYKIRKEKYYYEEKRVFPSYTPTGKNYLIEKSKRRMIAEDIKSAYKIIE
ncbi:MAG: uracil-DNA glycosylase family protein [Candidatus Aminicenantia bacterium]